MANLKIEAMNWRRRRVTNYDEIQSPNNRMSANCHLSKFCMNAINSRSNSNFDPENITISNMYKYNNTKCHLTRISTPTATAKFETQTPTLTNQLCLNKKAAYTCQVPNNGQQQQQQTANINSRSQLGTVWRTCVAPVNTFNLHVLVLCCLLSPLSISAFVTSSSASASASDESSSSLARSSTSVGSSSQSELSASPSPSLARLAAASLARTVAASAANIDGPKLKTIDSTSGGSSQSSGTAANTGTNRASSSSGLLSSVMSAAGAVGITAAKSMLAQTMPEVPYNILHNMKKMEHAAPFYGARDASQTNHYTMTSSPSSSSSSSSSSSGISSSGSSGSSGSSATSGVIANSASTMAVNLIETALSGMRSPLLKRLAETYGGLSTDLRSLLVRPSSVSHASGSGVAASTIKMPSARLLRDLLVPALFLFGLSSSFPDEWRPVRSRRKSMLQNLPIMKPAMAMSEASSNLFTTDPMQASASSQMIPQIMAQNLVQSLRPDNQQQQQQQQFANNLWPTINNDAQRRQDFVYSPPAPAPIQAAPQLSANYQRLIGAIPPMADALAYNGHHPMMGPQQLMWHRTDGLLDASRAPLLAAWAALAGSHLLRSSGGNNAGIQQASGLSERDLMQYFPQSWRDTMKRTVNTVQQTASNQWKSIEGQLNNWVREKVKVLPPVKWLDGALDSMKSYTSSSPQSPLSSPSSSSSLASPSSSSSSSSSTDSSSSKDPNRKAESQLTRVANYLVNTLVPLGSSSSSSKPSSSSSSASASPSSVTGGNAKKSDAASTSTSSSGANRR